jgi:TorA maturation chaperone TorD
MAEAARHVELEEEDRARALCYALASRLFYAPADADLLQGLGSNAASDRASADGVSHEAKGDDADTGYAAAFAALQQASRGGDVATLRQEYDDIFVSAGKALVTPYTSGYALPSAPDRHLVALREQLAAWGLARRNSIFEVEDHVAAVCDAMRWLIESGRALNVQRAFFEEFVYTGVGLFCEAVQARASTSFYRAAAAMVRAFLEVEREAFTLHVTE